MSRKLSDSKQPWQEKGVPWKSQQDYFTWLRGSIRRVWSRHPVKIAYKQARRYKAPVGRNGKDVWVSDCEMCGCRSRECEVDHIDGGYGFKDWDTFTTWAKRILWVTFADIRELCKDCHEAVTLSQKLGIGLQEAFIEKQVIAVMKSKQDKQWLQNRGVTPARNADLRREQVREIISKEKSDVDGCI